MKSFLRFDYPKGVAMTRCTKRFCIVASLLIIALYALPAQISLGFELGLLGTAGPSLTYEKAWVRSELGAHLFVLDYVRAAFTEDGFQDLQYNPFIGKAILSAKLTPTERHVLYGGVGLLGYFDTDNNYMLGVGPAVQFAWKFPNKQSELHIDLLLPLLFKHNYEEAIPDDDWPSAASFVYVMLIIMAPTIGFSWSF